MAGEEVVPGGIVVVAGAVMTGVVVTTVVGDSVVVDEVDDATEVEAESPSSEHDTASRATDTRPAATIFMAPACAHPPHRATDQCHGASPRGTLRAMTTPIAVVTGANRGLGLHFVDQLQQRGHRVVAGVRRPSDAHALHALDPLAVLPLDTGDADSIRSFGDAVRAHTDHLDLLVNNAGIMSASAAPVDLRPADDAPANGPLPFLEQDAMLTMFRVNSIGPVLVTQALDHLLGRGSVVVNLSSRLGSIGSGANDDYGYGMSKAALNMATTLLARELGGRGVVTVSVTPGWVRTDMGGSAAMLDAPESTGSIVDVVGRLTSGDNGTFIDHTGRPVAW